ncbi:ATP phosphoribosyltransferase [Fulvivirga imtechensis AK7]|uniref:ATP phosphoribosyltransferase n=1 Tax=Fulvivirga imtechensis AK7 TaxID=1237149 RepID=L8JUC5_9BACT|nr:ATP phosphoribosyltransferase [Fulvivirga imtechensis]ELR70892.1 ATP phosphoribosyltransferase [Fulvivirga imtechensis AK7]
MNKKIRIAVQKSGRLQEQSVKLLKECGLAFSNGPNRLKAETFNFPAEILFLRDDDIPQYVEDKVADIGIVGENVFIEKQKQVDLVQRLDFSKCRLAIAVSKDKQYDGPSSLEGKKIATSYPNIVNKFLKEKNINAEIHEISGSVEIAPGIGLADAICDIVSTGSTLLSNGLKEVETVMRSEAVLIANNSLDNEIQELLEKLIFRIKAVNTAKNNKYLLLNSPNESIEAITKVLPGMKSPTVTPLQQEGWSSLHSVVNENEFWAIIDQLKALGAQGILVVPIEKMII